jgi:hypothetical protein
MAKNVAIMGEYKFRHGSGGKNPERKRQFGRTTLGLEDNIKIDLKQISWENPGLEHIVGGFEHDNALT